MKAVAINTLIAWLESGAMENVNDFCGDFDIDTGEVSSYLKNNSDDILWGLFGDTLNENTVIYYTLKLAVEKALSDLEKRYPEMDFSVVADELNAIEYIDYSINMRASGLIVGRQTVNTYQELINELDKFIQDM